MSDQTRRSPFHTLIFLVGSTATGKTTLSLQLAKKWSASILNCDSIQMYKGMDIGSAKPVLKDRMSHGANWFFFDEWDPPLTCTAGIFRKKALAILKTELPQRPVIAVGGSGFYIQALEKGMFPVKQVSTEIKNLVQQTHTKKGTEYLYQWLFELDSEYAKQISSKDSYRIFRAICLILSEKKNLSFIKTSFEKKKTTLPYPILKIGLYLPKVQLLEKVQARTTIMLERGLIEETKSLLSKGLESWPLMKSVGYKEVVLFLKNQLSKDKLHHRIVQRTMRLAKKQMIWFKRDKHIQWFLSDKESFQNVNNIIKKHLNKGLIK